MPQARELRARLTEPGHRGGRVKAIVGRDLDRLDRWRWRRRRRAGQGPVVRATRRRRWRRARWWRRVGGLGQPPELELAPTGGRREVGDAGAVWGPRGLGDELVRDQSLPGAKA